jgi:uncharacterized sulfatase
MGQAMKDPIFLADRRKMVERFNRQPSLAKSFTAAGYRTLQTGKWWEGEACRCGFTEGMTHGDVTKGGRHGDEGLKIGRQSLDTVLHFIKGNEKSDSSNNATPFFIWYAPMMPHEPHNPPKRLVDKYRDKSPSIHIARYWAMCTWFDETVGDILSQLEKSGKAENTIVVFLADNGWIQKPDGPGFAPKSKRSPFDGGLRTPILVRYPARLKPAKSDIPVSSTDVAPTILHLAGLKVDPRLKGINLGDPKAVANRTYLPGAVFSHNAVSIEDPSKNLEYGWIIADNWKLIIPYVPNESTLLFDLKNDPGEGINLAKNHPDKVKELRSRLDKWFESTGLEP